MTGERHLRIDRAGAAMDGDVAVPTGAAGAVVFAHGSGSGRHSPRNRKVASHLRDHGLATLLIDLLTPDEEAADLRTGILRFDIDLLADRLGGAVDWAAEHPATRHLPIGCFGASTGAAAALVVAARQPDRVRAVVSRGGRPDLAAEALSHVRAPTLLIVGGADERVLELNRQAHDQLQVARGLEIVPRATHLFEESGALEQVARLAAAWFVRYLAGGAPTAPSSG